MSMSDYLVSIVRTVVPLVAGYLVSLLAGLGIEIDGDALNTVVTGVFIGGYYAAARALEEANPWFGLLLGWKAHVSYSDESS